MPNLRTMKILLVSNMYPSKQKPYSGIFVKNQFEGLQAYFKKESIKSFFMKRTFTSRFGSAFKYIIAFLKFTPNYAKKYDVIHLHFFMPLIIPVIISKVFNPNVKIVVTFHGSDVKNYFNTRLSGSFFSYIAKRVDFVIAVGNDLKEEIEVKLNRKVNKVLSAGVNQKVFYHQVIEKQYDFIFVGSFIERKGVDKLLEAIKILNCKSLNFCFVGSGPMIEDIRALKNQFNITIKENVTQEELRLLYNQSRFFILPSIYEPFGLVATEAIYSGTPAITSTSGGLKEQIQIGKNGFLIYENIPEKIAETMKMATNIDGEDYFNLVESTKNSNQEYSMDNILQQTKNIYLNLVK